MLASQSQCALCRLLLSAIPDNTLNFHSHLSFWNHYYNLSASIDTVSLLTGAQTGAFYEECNKHNHTGYGLNIWTEFDWIELY